jgi:hypothetical protein
MIVFSKIMFAFFLMLFGDTVFPQANNTATLSNTTSNSSVDTLRKYSNQAFGGGEYLRFDVNYEFITVGEAVMRINDTVYHNDRRCHEVNFTVDSKSFFDLVYKVRDRYRTVLDAEGLFPWRFEQHIREGGYTRDFIAEFDQIQHVAKTSEGQYKIPPYVHDIMSAFYFARTVDYSNFKPGQKIHLQNFYKDSTYELDVRFKGRQEIEVEAGKFKCVVIEPLAKEGGLFKSEGRVYVWLTDDERKIPVRVSSKVAIGSIDSELIEYRGINGPINAKINED